MKEENFALPLIVGVALIFGLQALGIGTNWSVVLALVGMGVTYYLWNMRGN